MGREKWTVGMRLDRVIWEHGMTKEDLANRAGIARSTVFRLCSGRQADLKTWEAIASVLGMTTAELFQAVQE